MNEPFCIPKLEYPISENALYADIVQRNRSGKHFAQRILTAEGRKYKQRVSDYLNGAGITTKLRDYVEYHTTVDVTVYAYRPNWYTQRGNPNKNAGDCANLIKVLQDVIFEAVGIDDCHVFATSARKLFATEKYVNVVISKTLDEVDLF